MDKFKNLDDVRAWVKREIEDGRDFIICKAKGINGELQDIDEASLDDLPKYINTNLDSSKALLKHRLEGTPLNLEPLLQLMYDTAFDEEEYKQIGDNDGSLVTLASLANKLGMTDQAELAMEAVYSYD